MSTRRLKIKDFVATARPSGQDPPIERLSGHPTEALETIRASPFYQKPQFAEADTRTGGHLITRCPREQFERIFALLSSILEPTDVVTLRTMPVVYSAATRVEDLRLFLRLVLALPGHEVQGIEFECTFPVAIRLLYRAVVPYTTMPVPDAAPEDLRRARSVAQALARHFADPNAALFQYPAKRLHGIPVDLCLAVLHEANPIVGYFYSERFQSLFVLTQTGWAYCLLLARGQAMRVEKAGFDLDLGLLGVLRASTFRNHPLDFVDVSRFFPEVADWLAEWRKDMSALFDIGVQYH